MGDSNKQPQLMISRSIIAKKEIKQLPETGQNFVGVWLDENCEKTDDQVYENLGKDLHSIFDYLEPCKKPMDYLKYLSSTSSNRIILIISHKCASDMMAIMADDILSQIYSMYILCSNESDIITWKEKQFDKIRGVYDCTTELISQIKIDTNLMIKQNQTPQTIESSSSTENPTDEHANYVVPTISVSNLKPVNNMIKHLHKDTIWFVRYQLLFHILLKLEKSTAAATEMIHTCKKLCMGRRDQQAQIDEFEKDIEDSFKSLYWYTKDSFIKHLLNRACGSRDVNEIYPFRLYISNLHHEIVKLETDRKNNKSNDEIITVYRGKYVALSTFEKLRRNKNGLIAMNGFLSTTKNETVAKFFINEGAPKSGYEAILFKLNIDPKVLNKPYADIPPERHEKGPDEEEILFSVGSTWRIIKIEELKDDNINVNFRIWCVELTLSDENDEQSKLLSDYLRKQLGESTTIWTLGDFLTKVGQYEEAEEYYRLLLDKCTACDQAVVFNRIAHVRYEKKDYHIAQDYLEKAMQHASTNSETTLISELNQQIITIETRSTQFCPNKLRRRFEEHDITSKYLVGTSPSMAMIKNNLGRLCHLHNDLEKALTHYNEALEFFSNSRLGFLNEISAIHNNIGGVYYTQGKYKDAAAKFLTAMETISEFDSEHPWISEYAENYQIANDRMQSGQRKRIKQQ